LAGYTTSCNCLRTEGGEKAATRIRSGFCARVDAVRNHCSPPLRKCYSGASLELYMEDDVRKSIIVLFGALVLLAGCESKQNTTASAPAEPKWKGQPYRIEFDTAAVKPNPSGVTIPVVKFTANPDALERRASLVVKFDTSTATKQGPMATQMIMAPVDISGAAGALPADYMAEADKGLSRFLGAYCIKGKVKITVALARSSLSAQADSSEVDEKRLSDWLPTEVTFKSPHPGC
jgi:hypothetical protein